MSPSRLDLEIVYPVAFEITAHDALFNWSNIVGVEAQYENKRQHFLRIHAVDGLVKDFEFPTAVERDAEYERIKALFLPPQPAPAFLAPNGCIPGPKSE